MNKTLVELLEKRGIKDITKLSDEEKVDYERWHKIFSTPDSSLEDITLFCESQKHLIEIQMRNLDNTEKKNERLILLYNVYSLILEVVYAPQQEKEHLERELLGYLQS